MGLRVRADAPSRIQVGFEVDRAVPLAGFRLGLRFAKGVEAGFRLGLRTGRLGQSRIQVGFEGLARTRKQDSGWV